MTLKSLTHWNYRVVKTTHTHPDGSTETNLGVHEAYYGPAGELSWTEEPVAPRGGNLSELRSELNHMLVALEIDVIDARSSDTPG